MTEAHKTDRKPVPCAPDQHSFHEYYDNADGESDAWIEVDYCTRCGCSRLEIADHGSPRRSPPPRRQ
jgi:hypothetical protein